MNSKRAFWGGILIIGGIYFLLKQFGWMDFHIDWSIWRKSWPIFLVLIGIRFLLPKENKAVGVLLILALLGVFIFSLVNGYRHRNDFSDGFSNRMPFDRIHRDFFNNHDFDDSLDNDVDTLSNDNRSTIDQSFAIGLNPAITKGELFLNGGAALFNSDKTETNIFEAKTHIDAQNKVVMKRSQEGNKETIELNTQNNSNKGSLNQNNTFRIFLNPHLLWNLNLNIGAGKVEYDLTDFNLEKLEFNSGAAEVDLRMGDKSNNTQVTVNSGLASFNLKIPKSSGCRIHYTAILGSKNLEGFKKVGDDHYETPGYSNALHKIQVDFTGGVSNLSVSTF